MSDDLDVLFPKVESINTSGGLVKVSKFKFRVYPRILVFANKYINEISTGNWAYLVFGETIQLETELQKIKEEKAKLEPTNLEAIATLSEKEKEIAAKIKLIETDGGEIFEDIAEVIKISTGKDREFLDDLDGDEVIDILLACVEVNAGFFRKILTDRLSRIIVIVTPKGKADTGLKSPDSSEKVTD